MIQMDIPAAFVCSQIFAYSGREWLAKEPVSWSGRYTALAACFALGVIGACGVYLYSGWTEWEMMYWSSFVQMNTANFGNYWLALVAPLFIAALGFCGMWGFRLAHGFIAAGKPKNVLVALWIGTAISLGTVLLTPSAPFLVGHYADYHAYVNEALRSPSPWSYGIFHVGGWTGCWPFAASADHLAQFHLITFFGLRFFVPWAIDIAIFVGSTVALSRWFKKPRQFRLTSAEGVLR